MRWIFIKKKQFSTFRERISHRGLIIYFLNTADIQSIYERFVFVWFCVLIFFCFFLSFQFLNNNYQTKIVRISCFFLYFVCFVFFVCFFSCCLFGNLQHKQIVLRQQVSNQAWCQYLIFQRNWNFTFVYMCCFGSWEIRVKKISHWKKDHDMLMLIFTRYELMYHAYPILPLFETKQGRPCW